MIPGSGRSPGGGKWQPTAIFLPRRIPWTEELADYSLNGRKELDMTELLSMKSTEDELHKGDSEVRKMSWKMIAMAQL